MRRVVVLLTVAAACLLPAAASAQYEDAKLGEVASVFAMTPVTVTCATEAEDPWHAFAWGYVQLGVPVLHVDAWLCDSIHDVTDSRFDLSRRALAVMVLTHEAYHARTSWDGRASEARTQCQAIRHFRVAAQLLGASPELATQLRTFALVHHWQLAAESPEYNLAGCKVPKPVHRPVPSPDRPPRP
jgi:hypothetical protein